MTEEAIRNKINFWNMLDKITGLKWKKQYPINNWKYKLDFYIPYTLIIEYNEPHQKNIDLKKIIYCRDWLAKYENNDIDDGWRCPFIRVKQWNEFEWLNRIIRHLVGFEILDSYNYNWKVCDLYTD